MCIRDRWVSADKPQDVAQITFVHANQMIIPCIIQPGHLPGGLAVAVDAMSVSYTHLYTNGDDQVNTAIEGGSAPDLVMEGPERLVANWGAKGVMAPLNDLWTDDAKKDIYASVESACHNEKGDYYEYPLCMTAHCMAVNMTKVKEVGADQYIDTDKHTWSTDGFLKTVDALYNGGYENVAAIYCAGQGGDQGTRAIINNMYGGTFTDAAHTKYTADSAENIKAIQALHDADGINFDASINGGEEITLFLSLIHI